MDAVDLDIRIFRDEVRVKVDFGQNVSEIDFLPHEAMLLSERLKVHAESLLRQKEQARAAG